MMKKYGLILLLLLTFLLLPATAVLAQTVVTTDEVIHNDVEVFEEDLIVEEGATIKGDVAVFNGNAVISGTIDGDLAVFNGTVTIHGTMDGDVAVFNSNLVVESGANFDGDCFVFNGSLVDNSGGSFECAAVPEFLPAELTNGLGAVFAPKFGEDFPAQPEMMRHEGPGFWGGVAGAGVSTLVMGFLAFVVAAAFPNHLHRVEYTARKKPIAGGTVGFLTIFAVPIVMVFLTVLSAILTIVCIGLLGFPIVIAMAFGFAGALLFGWIGMGNVLGRWMAAKLHLNVRNLKTTAVLGTVTLTFVMGVLGAIPFVFGESLVSGVILWIGLGAVMLTKFGRRPYPPHIEEDFEIHIELDDEKVTAVLDTLPDEPNTLKQN